MNELNKKEAVDKNDTMAQTERFKALFNYASIGIVLTNSEGSIIMANDFALNQFGYQFQEIFGKKVEVLIPCRFHSKHDEYRKAYHLHPQSRPMGVGRDLRAIKKDGTEFPVEVSLSHYKNSEGSFVIAFVTDISERIKARERIEKLNDELEHTVEQRTKQLHQAMQQLEVSKDELAKALNKEKELGELKSRFVTIASHEFRTPLSTILSSIYLIGKYQTLDEQPKREKHIQRIVSSVNMLTDILNDFLSLGKMEEGKIQVRLSEINLKELMKSLCDEIKNNLKKEQHIKYEHTGDTNILSDPSLLKHIVLNLLSNAIKFSPEGSLIEIYTEVNKKHIQLIVKDEGIGISKDEQQHLFERFFRASNALNIQGTGLGLHIMGKYAELLNGTIECISELNKGTQFKLTFNHPQI